MAFFDVESSLFLSIACMFHKRYSGEINDQQSNWKIRPDLSWIFLSLFWHWEHLFCILNVREEPWEEGIKEISASSLTAIRKENVGEMLLAGADHGWLKCFVTFSLPQALGTDSCSSVFFKDAFKASRMLPMNEMNGLCYKTCCFVDLQASWL